MSKDKGNNNKHQVKPRMQMKWLIFVGIILLIFSLYGIVSFPRNQRQILFEVISFEGWTGKEEGIYIDSLGEVYSFNRLQPNPFSSLIHNGPIWLRDRGKEPFITNQLFILSGNNSQNIGTISPAKLEEMVLLIDAAATKSIDYYDTRMRDTGELHYTAFQYDETTKTHTYVELMTIGPYSGLNKTHEAKQLVEWLESVCDEYYPSPEGWTFHLLRGFSVELIENWENN